MIIMLIIIMMVWMVGMIMMIRVMMGLVMTLDIEVGTSKIYQSDDMIGTHSIRKIWKN